MQQLQHLMIGTEGGNRVLELTVSGTAQCVGFARRWLEINRGLTFPDVDKAADIWLQVTHFNQLTGNQQLEVSNRSNGSIQPPRYGDLIIYNRRFGGTGHVAVVTAFDQDLKSISVVEQNYMNRYQSPGQQRQIPFLKIDNGFRLQQEHIIGWKHISSSNT